MSRASAGAGDAVVIKPSNNVYTALLAVAVVAVIGALVVTHLRMQTLYGAGLFGEPTPPTSIR